MDPAWAAGKPDKSFGPDDFFGIQPGKKCLKSLPLHWDWEAPSHTLIGGMKVGDFIVNFLERCFKIELFL